MSDPGQAPHETHRHAAGVDLTREALDDLVAAIVVRPAWHRDALCREYPWVNFFPGRGEDDRPARAVCAQCLVAAECLAFAMATRYDGVTPPGVWGGLSQQQRERLRERRPDDREARRRRVLELRAAGHTLDQIGAEVGCSSGTVRVDLGLRTA